MKPRARRYLNGWVCWCLIEGTYYVGFADTPMNAFYALRPFSYA